MSVVLEQESIHQPIHQRIHQPSRRAREHVREIGTRPRRRVRPRPGETRRPPTRARVVAGRRGRGAARCAPRVLAPSWPWLVVLALAICGGLVGLGAFVSGVAGMAGGAAEPVPDRTVVVPVAPGDTLEGIAGRFAPDSEPASVVERIQELNGLSGPVVSAGTPLIVPKQECGAGTCGGG